MLKNILTSSVGKKYLMALSGLALVLFVITHLAGNLALLRSSGQAFNEYADNLEGLGMILEALEVGLVGTFFVHIAVAIRFTLANKAARPVPYYAYASKGKPSKSNLSSRNMIITGSLLLLFLILHIWQFKFGPGVAQGYVADVKGKQVRDLYRLVVETFHNPIYVGVYVAVMAFLGFHIRHGFWSAFQSLGLAYPRVSPMIYCLGVALALLLATGFLIIPLWIFLYTPGALK